MQPHYTGKHEKQRLRHTSHKNSLVQPIHGDTLSLHCGNNNVENPCSENLSFQQKVSDSLSYSSEPRYTHTGEVKKTHHLLKYVIQLWTNQVEGIFWIWMYYHVTWFSLWMRHVKLIHSASAALKRDERDKSPLYYCDIMFGLSTLHLHYRLVSLSAVIGLPDSSNWESKNLKQVCVVLCCCWEAELWRWEQLVC